MSPCFAEWRCSVSPTGEKLYIPNFSQHKLLILARNGSVLATFSDPAHQHPQNVHVTPEGQVLVCGEVSNTIIQLDSEGRRKL
ncbi:hypothetical protein DPMN_184854 [Dreissena polymorpha]|uniref:Uncharacterized protein n=1 Tax=Dreissena polymorpha TaxID=45954 RepID=A0A9D4DK05_DREPO|nr:hypothetical protein DPMN_184854 [Dreissena polymorpha]